MAEDVFQDAFFRIWEKAHLFDSAKGNAFAWMATVTRRCALDRLASTKRLPISVEEIDDGFLDAVPANLGAGTVETITLKRCLERLDASYARAVLLTYYYGMTHEELAAQLGVPLGTAKSRVFRGLAKLKDCME